MNATAGNTTRSEVDGLGDRLALPAAFELREVFVDDGLKAQGTRPERAPTQGCRHRRAAQCCVLTMLQAASMLLAAGAQAQTDPCEQLKGVLAARIDATGVRGYTLETVPAGSSVPPDAKAIGTCQAGASKILYRRWGGARPASDGAVAAEPASAVPAGVAPDARTRRSTRVQADRASQPIAVPAPGATLRPRSRSDAAASAPPTPGHEPVKSPGGRASEAQAVRAIERAVAPPAQGQPDKTVAVGVPLARQASEFLAEHWRWMWALILLPLAGWVWAWHARRSAYDEAGLPRGPKL